jgi:transcriptional regulator with XRE-family HTH domain
MLYNGKHIREVNMEEVKKAIMQKGLKMKFVAKSLGMHPTYLSQILNGHRKPKETDRAALAGFLGISAQDIFFGKSAC